MVNQIEDIILKHHQRFFNEREYESFTSENVSLNVTPIVFGNDGRNGIDYQLYENDKVVFEAGMDIDEFRYVEFETENTIQDKSEFFKQLDVIDSVIDSQMTLELTDDDLNFQSLIEYGEL
jgi:hypothetical protein